MVRRKLTFVCTVLNEQETLQKLLDSLLKQTKKPDEIIFVDGGSTDNTYSILKNFQRENNTRNIKLFIKKGNRAFARNFGIKQAKGDIILLSDAGCILTRSWEKNVSGNEKSQNYFQ